MIMICVLFQDTRQRICVSIVVTTHVETVCLLSKLKSKEHIEIEVKMDEMDLTSSESKATNLRGNSGRGNT